MNKTIMLISLLFAALFIMPITSAATNTRWVFQENSTESYCDDTLGNEFDPVEVCEHAHDNDYGTRTIAAHGAPNFPIIYLNYTKPNQADSAIIQHKFIGDIVNTTVTTACFDNDPLEVKFRLRMKWDGSPNDHAYLECYDGSWNLLFFRTSAQFYEEGVFWNITMNESGLSMDSSPSWTTTQGSNTISCSVTDDNVETILTRDGVTVNNPYSATFDSGDYVFNCTVNDTLNYYPATVQETLSVDTGVFSCTNTSTFAFTDNVTGIEGDNYTFNLTSAVANNLVFPDLSDTYTTGNAWINLTGGFYLTVNVTGQDSVSAWWGNYIINNSYNFAPKSENHTNLTSYSEDNAYYVLTFIDEMSNTINLPPDGNTTLTMYCASGQTIISINDTRVILPTHNTKLDSVKATVTYTGDFYNRNYLIDNPVENKNIYLVDAFSFSVLQIPIFVNDYNFYDAEITIYKTVDGEPVTMTEGIFDTEHKFVAYLIRDEPYYIRLTSGATVREAGVFNPATAGSLTLNINTVNIAPGVVYFSDDVDVAAVNTSLTNIQITYNDSSGETQSIRVKVFENTNQTPFFDNTYAGVQSLSVAVTPVNMTTNYYTVRLEVLHDRFGNSPVDVTLSVGFPSLWAIGTAPTWMYGVIGFIMMLILGLSITPKDRLVGLVLVVVGLAILMTLTWTVLEPGILALIVVFASLSIVYEIKRGGFT